MHICVWRGYVYKSFDMCCHSDESDDDVIDNPLVAGDEDIDSEEDEPAPSKPVTMVADTKSITDDDDDDDEVDSTDKKNGRQQ